MEYDRHNRPARNASYGWLLINYIMKSKLNDILELFKHDTWNTEWNIFIIFDFQYEMKTDRNKL